MPSRHQVQVLSAIKFMWQHFKWQSTIKWILSVSLLALVLSIVTGQLEVTDVMARLGIASCDAQLYADKRVLRDKVQTLTAQNEKLENQVQKLESKLTITTQENFENYINVAVCESDLSSWGRVIGWTVFGFSLKYIARVFIGCLRCCLWTWHDQRRQALVVYRD